MDRAVQLSDMVGVPGALSRTSALTGITFPVLRLYIVQISVKVNAPPLLKRWIRMRGVASLEMAEITGSNPARRVAVEVVRKYSGREWRVRIRAVG